MLAIKDAILLDGPHAGQPNITILVEHGQIAAIGPDLTVPADASVINAKGLYAMPGLIDAHTHMGGSSSFDHPGSGSRWETYDYVEAREGFLNWGVTAVRTCGDQARDIFAFRDDIKAGKVENTPRIVACGPFLQAVDGHPWATVFMKSEKVAKEACIFADQTVPIERQVASVAQAGADFIKAFYAHVNKIDYPNTVPRMTREALNRIVASAHRNGLKCAVHVDGPAEMLDVAQAGADFIEHMIAAGSTETEFTPEIVEAVKQSGAVVDPTMISILRFDDTPGFPSVWEDLKRAVKQFYDAGIPLAVGCDSGIPFVPFGESIHDEMACFVEAGIPNAAVLHMATAGNAKVLGIDAVTGSLEPGKDADLLLLGADPLADIQNTRDIRMTMLRGKIVFANL